MRTVIEVKECMLDRQSEFNIKRFKVGNLRVERPVKVINAKTITKSVFEEYRESFEIKMFESSLYVTEKGVESILAERDEEEIKKHFAFKKWFREHGFVVAATLQFNPSMLGMGKVEGYLAYLYTFSRPIVLIPNVKIEKVTSKNGKRVKSSIISLDEYLNFVDNAVDFLDKRNNKPLFVPVSLRFGVNELKRIIDHYLEKEYKCLWFDFEGFPVSETRIARIRVISDEIERKGELKDIVIYATNIRREIISNLKDANSPASDVLAPIIGANIIGTNREPRRPIEPASRMSKRELLLHKARVLDPKTYYYVRVTEHIKDEDLIQKLLNKNYNVTENSKRLDEEFKAQTEFFLEHSTIKNYVSSKRMLREHKKGELLETLFPSQANLTQWY